MRDTADEGGGRQLKSRSRWLDGFVKWFFNASPLWVDERELEAMREPTRRVAPLRDRRAANGERRRESRDGMLHVQRRRGS